MQWKEVEKLMEENQPFTDDKPKCLIEGCGKERKWRGLCQSCYGQAKHVMDKEGLEWDDLIKLGLALPDNKPFYLAFHKAVQERQKDKG